MQTLIVRRLRLVPVLAGLVIVLWAGQTPAGEPQVRFRDLVYKSFEGDEFDDLVKITVGPQDQKPEFKAIEYKVLLLDKPEGQGVFVDPKTHQFKVGQRFQLTVRPLDKSYIYIYHIGASGKSGFLVPREEEEPRLLEPKQQIALPEEGYIEVTPPPGNEKVFVIAAAKPVSDRAALAEYVTNRYSATAPKGWDDAPKMKEIGKQINATLEGHIKTEAEKLQEKKDGAVRYRGLFGPADRKSFQRDVKTRKVRFGSLEIPPQKPGDGSLAVSFRAVDTPPGVANVFLVPIPLTSVGP